MTTEEHMKVETRLRKAGLRLTPQRYAVLDYLMCSQMHPTAEQIRADLNQQFPRASRATVYNTLNTLRDAGLIHEIYMDDAVARYDANIEPHHHFICRSCGKLEDIRLDAVSAISSGHLKGYSVEDYAVVMRGVCAVCSQLEARGKR
jgi:Fur family transcriptional regulator, peroxide stress response regulator